MGSDHAIVKNHVCAFAKDSPKKKRGNKVGKLKQEKLDFKREPCHHNVASKEYKAETDVVGVIPACTPSGVEGCKTRGYLPRKARKDRNGILATYEDEPVFRMSSSLNRKSGCGNLDNNFYRSRGSSSGGSCSTSCSEDDRDVGCLDDWEAVADVLNVKSNAWTSDTEDHNGPEHLISHCSYQSVNKNRRCQRNSRAWSPDDVFRPRSLPRIPSHQNTVVQKSEHSFVEGRVTLSWRRVAVKEEEQQQQPSVCPICCEDFDVTDCSFNPCPCGFRLCLFCHKRILEVDGRCPGCRKQYSSVKDGTPPTLQS